MTTRTTVTIARDLKAPSPVRVNVLRFNPLAPRDNDSKGWFEESVSSVAPGQKATFALEVDQAVQLIDPDAAHPRELNAEPTDQIDVQIDGEPTSEGTVETHTPGREGEFGVDGDAHL